MKITAGLPLVSSIVAAVLIFSYALCEHPIPAILAQWTLLVFGSVATVAILAPVLPESLPLRFSKWLWHRRYKIVFAACITHISIFSALSVLRHITFASHFYDLTVLVQPLFNSTIGKFMMMTWEDHVNRSRFAGGMIEGILIPVSWIYWIAPHPVTVLILQATAIGLMPVGIAKTVAKLTPGNGLALLASMFIFLTCIPLQNTNLFDFHAYGLLPPGVAFLVYGYVSRKWGITYSALAYCMFIRNELAVYGIALSFILMLRRDFRHAAGVFAFSIGYYWLVGHVISPIFGEAPPTYQSYHAHGHLGSGPLDIAWTILTRPGYVLDIMFGPEMKLLNFSRILWVGLLFPLIAALDVLILAAPITILYFSALNPIYTEVRSHYNAPISAVVIMAAVVGVCRILNYLNGAKLRKLHSETLIPLAVIVASIASYSGNNLSIKNSYHYFKVEILERYQKYGTHYARMREMVDYVNREIPKDKSVLVSSSLSPHICHRDTIYFFPAGDGNADFVLTDHMPGVWKGENLKDFTARVVAFLESGKYSVRKYLDGVVLLERKDSLSEFEISENLRVSEALSEFVRVNHE